MIYERDGNREEDGEGGEKKKKIEGANGKQNADHAEKVRGSGSGRHLK